LSMTFSGSTTCRLRSVTTSSALPKRAATRSR
jgi:hypothetical protein